MMRTLLFASAVFVVTFALVHATTSTFTGGDVAHAGYKYTMKECHDVWASCVAWCQKYRTGDQRNKCEENCFNYYAACTSAAGTLPGHTTNTPPSLPERSSRPRP